MVFLVIVHSKVVSSKLDKVWFLSFVCTNDLWIHVLSRPFSSNFFGGNAYTCFSKKDLNKEKNILEVKAEKLNCFARPAKLSFSKIFRIKQTKSRYQSINQVYQNNDLEILKLILLAGCISVHILKKQPKSHLIFYESLKA